MQDPFWDVFLSLNSKAIRTQDTLLCAMYNRKFIREHGVEILLLCRSLKLPVHSDVDISIGMHGNN